MQKPKIDIDTIALWRLWLCAFVLFSPIWLISHLLFWSRSHPEQLMVPFGIVTAVTGLAWYGRRVRR